MAGVARSHAGADRNYENDEAKRRVVRRPLTRGRGLKHADGWPFINALHVARSHAGAD